MDDQPIVDSESDLLSRLNSFSNNNTGMFHQDFVERILRKMNENVTASQWNQVVKLVSNQLGFWSAEWLFSPAHSPNIAAAAEVDGWKKIWTVCSDALVKQVPEIRDSNEKMHELILLQYVMKRRLDYDKTRPLEKIIGRIPGDLAIWLNKLGFKSMGKWVMTIALYPKGTTGRSWRNAAIACMNKLSVLGKEIETQFTMQYAGLSVYLHDHRSTVNSVEHDMTDPKLTSAERIEKAKTVLKIISVVREEILQKQLLDRHKEIHQKLLEFDVILKSCAYFGESSFVAQAREWLQLSKELEANRTLAISGISDNMDADEIIPKFVIENKGDVSGNISPQDSLTFKEKLAATFALIKTSGNEEKKIAEKREPISESLFGKKDKYMKFGQEQKR
jgi:hypothetical protein